MEKLKEFNLILHSALVTFIFVKACTIFPGPYCHITHIFFHIYSGFFQVS